MVVGGLIAVTLGIGGILGSYQISAAVIDDVAITVPVACTLTGTGMDSHTATINPGVYQNNIGTTTLKVLCNDNSGFAIYAAGYTGEEVGGTNSNKLVGNATHLAIDTGVAQSGTTSNWAMKLATNANATFPITIDAAPNVSGGSDVAFDDSNYHTVPNEYVKVAYRNAGTDVGTTAVGSTLTTTYAAFISSDQPADTYVGKVIYTMVHPSTAPAPGSQLIMQDVATWGDTLSVGDEIEVIDSRDGKVYTAAKLADGNIWMTQNLDHDIDSTKTYTPADTDIPANWTPSTSTYATSNTTWNWSATAPESYDPGTLYWTGTADSDGSIWQAYYDSCDYSGSTPVCNESLNPVANGTLASTTGNSHYHLGNYYNWTAAIAMNDSSSYTTSYTLIDQSICPAGWTLPRVGYGEDTFYGLWSEYGYDDNSGTFSSISTLTGSPAYFAPTGGWGGSFGVVGASGGFWSPVVRSSVDAYYAGFGMDGGAGPSVSFFRDYGDSVRCVARPVTSTLQWESGGGSGGGEIPSGPLSFQG